MPSGLRLDDRQCTRSWRDEAKLAGELLEARHCLWAQPVVHERPAPLSPHPTGVTKHFEVVADRRLRDLAAGSEVARADVLATGQLAQNRQSGGIGGTLQQEVIRVGRPFHDK